MDEKERKNLQNDILLMSEISRQYDLYDSEQAKSVRLFMEKRHPLTSVRANAFLDRINLLASDDAPHECTCLLCGRAYAIHGVFCSVCQDAIDRSVSHADDNTESNDVTDESISEVAQDESIVTDDNLVSEGTVEPAASEETFTYEIEEEPFSGEISPDNEVSVDETSKLKRAKNLKQFIPLAIGAAVAIALLFYAVFTVILPAQNLSPQSSRPKVETQADAEKIISSEYDEAEYISEYQETISMPEGMFEVAVGDSCGDKWDSELCEVMVYYIRNIEDPGQYATIMVAPSGRTIGSGTLIMPDDELTMYRIK